MSAAAADPRIAGGRLTIDLDALAANYRALAQRSAPAIAAAVVKADAYGIGLERAAPALAAAGCTRFFVALPGEGVKLRQLLPDAEIFVLSGVFDEASAAVMAEAGLVPVLNSLNQIEIWARFWRARGSRRPCAIHVDTGMSRLGLTVDEALGLAARNGSDHAITPILVMSHLACADTPDHPKNRTQLESFQRIRQAFSGVDSSLANSAGIFLGPEFTFEVTRPGVALFGGVAVEGIENPLRPVVTAEARIIQIRHVRAGETASYGATVTLDRDTVIAVAATGYADGYHRALSGSGVPLREAVAAGGTGFVAGHEVPVLGRVTMDLTLFDITDVPEDAVTDGDWIELFGANIPLEKAAKAAGTIGYELLTSLGRRYWRRYVNSTGSQ